MRDYTSGERSILYYLSLIQKYIFKIVYETTVKKYDLHPGQIPILFLLEHKPGASQREIAISINVEPGTIAVMLKRMERKGLIYRRIDEKDRRISRVYLTDKAQAILSQIKEFTKETEEIILSELSDIEKSSLMSLLSKVKNHLSNYYIERGGTEC
ncbi:MAG TPA: MarR family transcriptional regulator [Fervidobacterium sp.]|nr:MarR family transcriptional regulator [Fervidobacterium sp.]HPT53708.1 MarR family transcriptional regulator [Fervidobacterium sp.]HPZ16999.1 MarR family transcriptional regulator [Fervidobacterium sp.]HQE47962.1 MarR family transcriptional regulator [Fervidobacterium sp.]HUM41451.1 MarR family transcriptional regulator [Fervidobacterium sp.]